MSAAERLREAARAVLSGGIVEDALRDARDAVRETLSSLAGGEREASLVELSYQLEERGLLTPEVAEEIRELDRMREMAHHDIFSVYEPVELAEKLEKLASVLDDLLSRASKQ